MICKHTLPVGSRKEDLTLLVKQIHDEVCKLDSTIADVCWIPTELNIVPDWLSRYQDVNDWTLRDEHWRRVQATFPGLTVDRFSSGPENSKLPRFNTRWATPFTSVEESNALAQNWKGTFSYACPPLAMVGRVLQHVKEQKARAVVIVPVWPQKEWFPLLKMMTIRTLHLGRGLDVFQVGPSGQCAPAKNPRWEFQAVEVDGSKFPSGA
jgi:hypothetical protein